MSELIVPNSTLLQVSIAAGVPDGGSLLYGDEAYRLYTEHDVTVKLATQIDDVLTQLNFTYRPEIRDCDDFALFTHGWSVLLNALNKGDYPVAFGECWCAALEHAFCIAYHEKPNVGVYQAFYEPQMVRGFSLTPLKLTDDDVASIFMIKL